jgi:hypothetical protein
MLSPTLTLTLASQQVLHVHMSEPQERLTYEALAKYQKDLDKEKAELCKTYHLGDKPTPGRGYDDRLTVRLGPSRSTLMAEIALWRQYNGKRGGLAHVMGGNKYWVCEQYCRDWVTCQKQPKAA